MRQSHFSVLVISFAAALAVFFALPVEPPIWVPLSLLLLAAAWLEFAGQRDAYRLMRIGLVILVFALGFSWAQGRTHWHAHESGTLYVPPPETVVELHGVVDWSEPTRRGSKVDLAMQDYLGRPFIVQLYGKQWHAEKLRPGCRVEIAARLRPLPLPIVIDGHDPRLRSWFAGQRGRGFIKSINATNCDGSTGWAHRLANWRLDLAAHYRATMSAESGAVAAALVTGVRGMISPDTRRAFRHSGLAHMLAISGLHMALFAGSVYALIRLLAALWPALVLRRDMRKPAALVALLAATGYLVISGAGIATQRAYIMLAIFFLAVLLDRPAITMRNVLWAALIVLLIQPHAIMQVGFQMSFAAVMALVAVYEAWRRNDRLYMRLEDLSPWLRAARIGWRYVSALTVTSLIAGGVTGFIALTQFYQIGNYGLPANLLAMPIFGTLIMPMAPLSLVLLPTGFDWLALSIMQTGIETVLALAAWVTAFDGALWRAGASPDWVLPVAATGFVWLCLVNARWRFLGVLPIALATLYLGSGNRPVAHLVGRDAIVVQEEGRGLKLMRSNGRSYELGVMARYPCKALLLDEPKLQRGVPLQIVSDGRHLSIKRARRARLWQRARRTTE